MLNKKKLIECLKVFILWLNYEAKLRELVDLPNRVQFQIHPLSDVKVKSLFDIKAGVKEKGYVAVLC